MFVVRYLAKFYRLDIQCGDILHMFLGKSRLVFRFLIDGGPFTMFAKNTD